MAISIPTADSGVKSIAKRANPIHGILRSIT